MLYIRNDWDLLAKLNARAKKNLKYVWPKITQNKLDNICKNMWKNLGKNFAEFIFLKNYDPIKCKNTQIIGLNYTLNQLVEKNRIKKRSNFFSAHYGNWEIGPYIIKKLDVDLMGIYRKSNNICIDKLIQKYRNKDTVYVPKGDIGAKKSYLWLRKGKKFGLTNGSKT